MGKIKLPPGFQYCPHCRGRSKCKCDSCGTKIEVSDAKRSTQYDREEGICKVCRGKGMFPKPYWI